MDPKLFHLNISLNITVFTIVNIFYNLLAKIFKYLLICFSCFCNQAERELRVAQSEFDRQAEITKLLLEGVSSSQAGHLRCLHEFVEAQTRHFAQCHATMQELQRELAG